MIDFDEIEDEEKRTLDQHTIDEERRQREEDERRSREEAARFKLELLLEQEIERRCLLTEAELAEEKEGQQGLCLRAGSGEKFVDGINGSLLAIGRLFAKHRSEHGSFDFLQRGLAALVAYLNAFFLCRFAEGVVVHLEQLQKLFARPKGGLCALVQDFLPCPPEVKENKQWQKLAPCVLQILALLRRAQCWVTVRRPKALESLGRGHGLLADFFQGLVGEVPLPEWPGEGADLELALQFRGAGDAFPVKVKGGASVLDLKHLLVECWQCPPCIVLCCQSSRRKCEPLPPDVKLRSLKQAVVLVDDPSSGGQKADAAGSEAAGEEEEEAAVDEEEGWHRAKDYVAENVNVVARLVQGGHLPPDWNSVAGIGWVARWHVLRTTPVTATRLLNDLRTRFQSVDFQEMYKELKMRMRHIDCALKVQTAVLPTYGFADSIIGVNDMRGEITAHEQHHHDLAVEKLRKEIHGLLEYGEPPRKVPVTRALDAPRFPVQQAKDWMAHLASEGFAVIAGVANSEQVELAYRLLWDFIEGSDAGGIIRRGEVRTWFDAPARDRGWPGERDDGIIHTRGIGQSEVLWYLRTLPSLQSVFAKIWGTEDLVTSFDGAGVFRPYGQFESWRTTKKNWFHVDQTHRRRGLHCVQGLLNMKRASRETGGLVVVPGSHRLYGDLLRRYDEPRSQDSLHLDVTDPILTEGDSGPRLVCAEAGDLIVWDSRTVHCNTPPLVDDAALQNASDLIRAVAYICMTPADWCAKEVLTSKLAAAGTGITTTHVPHAYRPMDVPERFPALQLTIERKRLVVGREKGELPASPPGGPSVLPERKFQVAGTQAQVRASATLEWGSSLGALERGSVVSGHAFGKWLRLSQWPPGALSREGKSEHEEFWVPMNWKEGHLEPFNSMMPLMA